MKRRVAGVRVAAAVTMLALLGVLTAQAEPVKIRISWMAVPDNLPPLLMEKPELMTRAGQSYTVDAVQFTDMAQSVAALNAGDLDIALLTFSALPLATQNGKREDLRIISDEFIDGMSDRYSAEFVVLKDGPIKDIKDLKGKTVAIDARGGPAEMALRAIARKYGFEEKRDYTLIEVARANMKAALLEKKMDLAGLGAPALSEDPAIRDATRTLFNQRDALGPSAQVIWVARKDFLEKNRAIMVDFMTDALRVRRYLIDPKNHDDAVGMVSHYTKQPAAQLQSWLFAKDDFYRTPDGILDAGVLQKNIDRMAELGFLKNGFDIKKYQDMSILKEAGSRLPH